MLRALRTHAQETGKQFLWATHSPIFAPFSDDGSVHLVQLDENGQTSVQLVDMGDAEVVRKVLGHSNADLYN